MKSYLKIDMMTFMAGWTMMFDESGLLGSHSSSQVNGYVSLLEQQKRHLLLL